MGATVDKGEIDLEARYGTLSGGPDEGKDAFRLEAGYGVSDRLSLAGIAEFEREPSGPRKAESAGIEAVYHVGRVAGIDVALYGEYQIAFDGTDKLESKLILQHRRGPIDLRLNMIAEKALDSSEPFEFEYAAAADVHAFGEISLGARAFGELGSANRLFPHAEHFAGPVAKVEIEGLGPEIGLEAGYLFALGKAREDTNGQVRVVLELEF